MYRLWTSPRERVRRERRSTCRDIRVFCDRFLVRTNPFRFCRWAEQLPVGLAAHIQSVVDHPCEAVAINRGALSRDPVIHAIIAEERPTPDRLTARGREPAGHHRDRGSGAVSVRSRSLREMNSVADYLTGTPHRNFSRVGLCSQSANPEPADSVRESTAS